MSARDDPAQWFSLQTLDPDFGWEEIADAPYWAEIERQWWQWRERHPDSTYRIVECFTRFVSGS